MSRKKMSIAIFAAVAALVTVFGWVIDLGNGVGADYVHAIRRNVEVFGLVYQEISKKYVDPVDPDKFMKAGINGMLQTLDPYTVLIEQEDNSHLQIITTGKYGGLGMKIGEREGYPTVVDQPYEDDPAGKAGIREGDSIIEIDGQSTKGMSINDVAKNLRGEIGTAVEIKIQREGEFEPLEFRLIRAEITVHDISHAGLIEDGIGYVKLAGFSKNAGYEIKQAIRDMKPQGLRALVLDLRNNPGGLLDAAVSVSENFVEQGALIVSTKGRDEGAEKEYRSSANPALGSLPLVVLVNEYSASASEIVAGAVQDLDRGVVIGKPTFGKGLVQTVVPLTRDAALKITTAKYYVPSGRLIQRPDRLCHDCLTDEAQASDGHAEVQPDTSLHDDKPYYTRNQRQVFGGGGIKPDIEVESPRISQYEYMLRRKSMPFHFALVYAHQHPELAPEFAVDDTMLAEFKKFIEEKGFSYTSQSEEILRDLRKAAEEEGYLAILNDKLQDMEKALQSDKLDDFEKSRDFIKQELKMEIAAKLFGTRAKVEAGFKNDPVLQEALRLLKDQGQYSQILNPKAEIKG